MSDKNESTFLGGLLVLLLGIPSVINAGLDAIAENTPFLGAFVKPTFWTLFGFMVLQWMLGAAGLDVLLASAWDGLMGVLSGLFTFIGGLFVSAPDVVVTPITVEEAVKALKDAAALTSEIPTPPSG
jgi:hypothetical protein